MSDELFMIMKSLNISENVYNRFSLTDTNIVKGVAIILLLFHHCFLQSSVDMVDGNINFFPVSQELGIIICHSLKLCVGIFVFLSGYGMLCSVKKMEFNIKNIAKWIGIRLAKMMSGFYFVYLIVFAVTMLIDKYPIARYYGNTTLLKGTMAMIIDFLGLAKLFGSRTLIGTWWYISAAIVFVVICPFLYKLAKKVKYVTLIALTVVVPRLITGFPGGKSWVSFLAALLLGMMFADYDLFDKFGRLKLCKNQRLSDSILFAVFAALLVAVVWVNYLVPWNVCWEWDFAVAPVIVILFTKKFIAPIKGVRNVLLFLGNHSMNIYLLHTFFRYVYLTDFIYSFKYAVLIFLVLMIISLVSSIGIEGLKKVTKYNMLTEKTVKKISDL